MTYVVLCNAKIPTGFDIRHCWRREGGRTNRTGHKASCSILSTKTSKFFSCPKNIFPRYLMRKTSKKLSFGPQGRKGRGRKKLYFADFATWRQKNIPCRRHTTLINKSLWVVIYQARRYRNFEAMQLLYLGQPAF